MNLAKPKALNGAQLHALYKGGKVPGHRYLYSELQQKVAAPAELAQPPAKPAAPASAVVAKPSLSYEGLNLAQLIEALLGTDGSTEYEQLTCVGLNPQHQSTGRRHQCQAVQRIFRRPLYRR